MRNGARLRIVSDGQLVGFADGEIGNCLSERAGTLDKRDEVLVRYCAVVRESAPPAAASTTNAPAPVQPATLAICPKAGKVPLASKLGFMTTMLFVSRSTTVTPSKSAVASPLAVVVKVNVPLSEAATKGTLLA